MYRVGEIAAKWRRVRCKPLCRGFPTSPAGEIDTKWRNFANFGLNLEPRSRNSFGSGFIRRHSIRFIPSQSETQLFEALAEKLRIRVRCFSSTDLPSHIIVEMPALSPTMNQGNIAKWKKKEGDKINSGDVLCEIETDKATLEFESLEEGFLAKILTPEGSKDVPVGQPIAITVEDLEDIKNIPAAISSSPEKGNVKQTHEDINQNGLRSSLSNALDLPPHMILEMPALSPTMNKGNIARWRKKEGDKIDPGDVLCEIETDKATLEFESLEEGFLAKILTPEGSKDVPVGQPIAITVENQEDVKNIPCTISAGLEKTVDKPIDKDRGQKEVSEETSFSRISPSAKLLIKEFGLDASTLKASGPRNTLLKGDILAVVKSGSVSSRTPGLSKEKLSSSIQQPQTTAPSPPQSKIPSLLTDSYEDIPNSQIRKVIAKRLIESKQNTPHLYLASDVVLDSLLAFRNVLKEQHNVKVSINDIIIKAVAVALREVPEANAFWNSEREEVSLCQTIDISIAVATDKGLITPIVRNADQKTLSAISQEVKDLAEKARLGKLAPNEYQGGTFSISNLGMFPVDNFCAIINPPQACILAVGRANKVVTPMLGSDGIEVPTIVTKMNLNLSADHRVFDGEIGGKFLSALSANLSDVRRLML